MATAAERDSAGILSMNLLGLTDFVVSFEYAVRLADHADLLVTSEKRKLQLAVLDSGRSREEIEALAAPVRIYGGWMSIAAKEAAMAVYHFHMKQQAVMQGAAQVSSISALVNMERLHEARVHFSKHFPHAKEMRNAIGHDAERTASAAARKDHGFTGTVRIDHSIYEGTGLFWSGMDGRTLRMARYKKLVSVTVDEATLDRLIEVQSKVLSAFDAVLTAYKERVGWPRQASGI
jgi:hypothetical protein